MPTIATASCVAVIGLSLSHLLSDGPLPASRQPTPLRRMMIRPVHIDTDAVELTQLWHGRQGTTRLMTPRGSLSCPRIAQETLRRTSRMCVTACRRVQAAQRMRSRALGANGRFAAYKAEVAGSR